jgi:excisionase family DNA binding protein
MEQLLVRVPEACSALGIRRTTLYKLIANGDVTACKVGRARCVSVASLRRFVRLRVAEGSRRAGPHGPREYRRKAGVEPPAR